MIMLPAALPTYTHSSQALFPVFRLHIMSTGIPQDTLWAPQALGPKGPVALPLAHLSFSGPRMP